MVGGQPFEGGGQALSRLVPAEHGQRVEEGEPRVRPMTATRIGAWALPSLRPMPSAMASVAACSASTSHAHVS